MGGPLGLARRLHLVFRSHFSRRYP